MFNSGYKSATIVLLLLSLSILTIPTTATTYPPQTPLPSPSSTSEIYLQITALTSSTAPPHHPLLNCLRLASPLQPYPKIGSSAPLSSPGHLPLSSSGNMTLVTLPPHSSEGWHNPPMAMWFVLLSGRAVVTTYEPDSDQDGQVMASVGEGPKQKVSIDVAGPNQFILALDLLGRGHWTDYHSDEDTWALQIPLAEGWEEEIATWEVIGEGACTSGTRSR